MYTFDPPEDNGEWVLGGQAAIGSANGSFSPPNALFLRAVKSAFGDIFSNAFRAAHALVPGATTFVRARVNGDSAGPVPLIVAITASGMSFPFQLNTTPGPGWQLWEAGSFIAPGPSCEFLVTSPVPLVDGQGFWVVDDLVIGDEPLEELMARSTTASFMEKLKALVLATDPNIGKVFVTTKNWTTLEDVRAEGVINVAAGGVFDGSGMVGDPLTRFWIMQPSIKVNPLTNGSAEYVSRITLTGFFVHKDGDAQETALLKAAVEVLDKLNTLAAELTDLNTGTGYLGFLLERPSMSEIVQASLGEGVVKGSTVRISVSFAEEVSYS